MKLPLTYVAETLEKLFGPGHDLDNEYDWAAPRPDKPTVPSIADNLQTIRGLLTAAYEAAGAAAGQLEGARTTRAHQLSELIADAIVHADRLAFVHPADVRYGGLMRERT